MSAALDTMTADETALLKQMEADDASLPPEPLRTRPEPEAQEPADPQAKEHGDDKVVDKRALDKERSLRYDERERRKKAEKEATESRVKYESELARVNERFNLLAQAAQAHVDTPAKAAVEEAVPAFESDPRAWIEHNIKTLDRRQAALDAKLAEVAKTGTQFSEQQRQQHAVADLQAWGAAQEQEFARQAPDYQNAMQHLMGVREAQLRAIGVDDPAEIRLAIQSDVFGLANMARQKGKQLGEVLYKVAEANGYRRGATQEPARPAPTIDADSAAERLLRGNDMATTLGSTGGAAQGEPAANAIAGMDEAAFAKMLAAVKKQGPAAMQRLFGK